jgi:hypothetical protein
MGLHHDSSDGKRRQQARATNPSWLMALSGLSKESGDNDGVPWCSLCLRKEGDEADPGGTSTCAAGQHLFCASCADACGGALLCRKSRCPLCRLGARACGFDALVQASRPLRLPHPSQGWAGTQRLLLRGTLSVEDRCELTTAIAADRCRELRQSMRPKPKPIAKPKQALPPPTAEKGTATKTAVTADGTVTDGTADTNDETTDDANLPPSSPLPAYDPSDVGAVMRAFAAALPAHDELPPGLCDDVAVVSNSSALLGRNLGETIDAHGCVVGLHKLNSVDPQFESTWLQPLNVSREKLVSSLCF